MGLLFVSGGQSTEASALAISPFSEYSGLISFRFDWFDLLAVEGTLKSLLQEQTYGCRERGGEGEMYVENNMETYNNICKIDSQWEFAVCLREGTLMADSC